MTAMSIYARKLIPVLLGILLAAGNLQAIDIQLNEIMASNLQTISDEDGDFPDWIEIYNYGDKPIQLEGFALSDDYSRPMRWIFPDVTIEPQAYLLVWASGKDRRGQELHTNFAISSSGEEVLLSNPDGSLIDELSPREIPADISVGRLSAGRGEWQYFSSPSPGRQNSGNSYTGISGTVEFSQPGGFYPENFLLELSSTEPDAKIYYSLDGSDPSPYLTDGDSYLYKDRYRQNRNETEGELVPRQYGSHSYHDGIEIANQQRPSQTVVTTVWEQEAVSPRRPPLQGTVVRAVLVEAGYLPGEVITHSYVIGDPPSIPSIFISTAEDGLFSYDSGIYVPGRIYDEWRSDNMHIEDIPGDAPANFNKRGRDWERPSNLEIYSNDGEMLLNQSAGLRIHGGWSRSFPQKNLRLYARNSYGDNEFAVQLFPESSQDSFRRFILRNSGNDFNATIFRDALIHELLKDRSLERQRWQPVVHFINGEYWGVLNIRDRLDKHHLASQYGVDPDRLDILTHNAEGKEGDAEHYNRMINYATRYNLNDRYHFNQISRMMDIENFAEYFAINIYVNNYDWPGNNIDFWRLRTDDYTPDSDYGHDGRWRWMLYDMDFGLGIWGTEASTDSMSFAAEPNGPDWPNPPWSTLLFRELLESERFQVIFLNLFADLSNSAFEPNNVRKHIAEMKSVYDPVIDDHIARWGTVASRNRWENEIRMMQRFTDARPAHIRRHVINYFDLEGSAEIELSIASGQGHLRINSLDSVVSSTEENWKGIYFRGVPVEIEAVPSEGYRFSHWDGGLESEKPMLRLLFNGNAAMRAYFTEDSHPQ